MCKRRLVRGKLGAEMKRTVSDVAFGVNSIKNIRIRNFEELKLSVSIGCAFNTNNRSYENLYKFADRALFEAKKVKNFKIIYIK